MKIVNESLFLRIGADAEWKQVIRDMDKLGFKPRYQPEKIRTFFTAAEGWGSFAQERKGTGQTDTISVRYGRLAVRELVFEVPQDAKPKAEVSIAGKPVQAELKQEGTEVRLTLPERMTVDKGSAIRVTLSW